MESVKEKSLIEALAYVGLRDLPKEDNKEFVWIKALALVAKSDGSKSYIYLVKDKNGNPKVKKDFGNVAVIKDIVTIYPFMLLDEKFVPSFQTKTKAERIEWLQKFGDESDLSECNFKELERKVLNLAMQHALASVNN